MAIRGMDETIRTMSNRILFDATIIASGWMKNANRSGIYFVAVNILQRFLQCPQLKVSLYCTPSAIRRLHKVLQEILPEYASSLSIVNEKDASRLELVQQWFIEHNQRAARQHSVHRAKMFSRGLYIAKVLTVIQNRLYRSHTLAKALSDFDIFFSPGYAAPVQIRQTPGIKRYTILYDTIPLLFPELYPVSRYFGYSWVKVLIKNLTPDDYGFAISEQTKKDFIRFCPQLNPQNITVTPLAASENFYFCKDQERISAVKAKYHIPLGKRYIFSLCTLEPRKNLIMTVKSFLRLIAENKLDDLMLVLGGGHHECFIGVLENLLHDVAKYKDRIIMTGYIDDEDLAPLYSGAEFFVYPSLYEGFGLPPLEAMQCGCPVIVSNTSSLPEVVGNAGLLIGPHSEHQLVAAMKRLYDDWELRTQLLQKGLQQAQQFSWDRCAATMIDKILECNKLTGN